MHEVKSWYRGIPFIILLFLVITIIQYASGENPNRRGEGSPGAPPDFTGAVIPNQIVIQTVETGAIEGLLPRIKGVILSKIRNRHVFLVSLPSHYPVDRVAWALNRTGGVKFAHPNYRIDLPEVDQISQSFPDEDMPVYISGVSPITYYEQAQGQGGSDSANMLATGAGVIAGIIDNGIEFSHPLFTDAFADSGYDFVDDDADPSEEAGDLLGHGTFVAGLVKLMAPDCMLIPYRSFDEGGVGSTYRVAQAIYQAIDDSVNVINMSFSMTTSNSLIEDAVSAAYQAGVAMVASAGNGNSPYSTYPAAYTGVVAVSAVDTLEYKADFSNYGDYVDVCAAGVNVYSSLAGDYDWGTWNGTSFSAPQVTGICALILDLKPGYSGTDVEDHVRLTAETELGWGTVTPPDSAYGYGLASALRAVKYLRRGDVDDSRTVDSLDVNYLLEYLNNNGPDPVPIYDLGDVDCSGEINMVDVNYLINYLESGGPAPGCL
jgi:subtilisin family serine protease